MGGYVEFSVYLSCLSFVIYLYSCFVITFGIIDYLLYFVLISCALFGILLRFHIPRPADETVANIFGSEWGAYKSLPNSSKVNNDYVMKVVAHRACGLDAPENSLSAIKKIMKESITAVEFDIMLTADNKPIVFHDTSLYRMTGVHKIVAETTLEEIRKLDISVKHPFKKNFEGEKVPTLEEYTKYCLDNNIRMFLDLKDDQLSLCETINNLFKEYPKLYDLAVVSSFNPFLIYRIRMKDPKIACSLAWRPYFYSHEDFNEVTGPTNPRTSNLFLLLCLRLLNVVHEWFLWTFGYYTLGLSALLLHKDMVTRDIIHYWTKRGVRAIAWSVNLPTEKQYFEKILQITYLTDTAINS